MRIVQHVYQFDVSARIELLSRLLRNRDQLQQLVQKYPLELIGPEYRAVMMSADPEGFTIDGWTDALWKSL